MNPFQPVRITDTGEEGCVVRYMPRRGLYLVAVANREQRMVHPEALERVTPR